MVVQDNVFVCETKFCNCCEIVFAELATKLCKRNISTLCPALCNAGKKEKI